VLLLFYKTKHKVSRHYSGAEEYAPSQNAARDDVFNLASLAIIPN
jgi:hypothetical protein